MKQLYLILLLCLIGLTAEAQEFKIYQFAPDELPTIDGKGRDWRIVPDEYRITEPPRLLLSQIGQNTALPPEKPKKFAKL